MEFTATMAERTVDFVCADQWAAHRFELVLAGETYPYLSFVEDVRVVWDVGAGAGAASVFFATRYPEASIHAVERGGEARAHLERNTRAFPNVTVHAMGLPVVGSGTARIDVLKADGEADAPQVLAALGAAMPNVKVCYVGYSSRTARRELARALDPSHELFGGRLLLDEGACIYVRRDLADLAEVRPMVRNFFDGDRA